MHSGHGAASRPVIVLMLNPERVVRLMPDDLLDVWPLME